MRTFSERGVRWRKEVEEREEEREKKLEYVRVVVFMDGNEAGVK